MVIASIISADIVGLIAMLGIAHLVRRRLLTMGLALSWLMVVGGLMTVVTMPWIRVQWIRLSSAIFDSPPYLIALVLFLLAFLLYISVVVSVLQRQVREISQFVALAQVPDENKSGPAAK